jgi:hypothetical protein
MQHRSSKPGAPAADPGGSAKWTTARTGSSLVSMQDDTSKPDAPAADPNAVALVYVDDRELVRRTSIARATWQKMRIEGRGPAVRKVGRRCLYRWSEVVAWLESHRVGGGAS